ncbi:DUF202 domain-containing protein [Nocardia sp. NPDC051030]|uniref:YidH family protein n=1 Tax=Nocardia sp. NPDC051030 TaxID=3155162 RepID=UPI0034287383
MGSADSPADPKTEEPELDYRFTLANERTFLAWMRTALGLLAGGVAVHELVRPFRHHGVRTAIAMACLVLAAVIAVGAYGRWRHVQAAMERGAPMPRTVMVPILAFGIAVIAVLAGIGLLQS